MADIFCLKDSDGRLLHPSVQATVLAKYSRSPESARDILRNVTREEADKFHSKWVLNFGHSSVAEMAVIPICFEGLSIIATKFVEQYQRPAYCEKSTRYQHFSKDSFVTPPGAPSTMASFAGRFYAAYEKFYPFMLRRAAELFGLDSRDESVLRSAKVKARAFDNLRYLLPAGTGTSLGAVINLRDVRYMAQDALGHRNPEIREIGRKVVEVASEVCPTLIGDPEPDDFEPRMLSVGPFDPTSQCEPGVHLVHFDPTAEARMKEFVKYAYGMSWADFSRHMQSRKENQQVPKVFKMARLEVLMVQDYGAYRDLQRHRRCEQYSEPLTPFIGYVVPDDVKDTIIEPEFRRVMESVTDYDEEAVTSDPELQQYIVPMGSLHRSRFDMDLREVYYMSELRSKPHGHISYRRTAWQLSQVGSKCYPDAMQWCRAHRPDTIGEHT